MKGSVRKRPDGRWRAGCGRENGRDHCSIRECIDGIDRDSEFVREGLRWYSED